MTSTTTEARVHQTINAHFAATRSMDRARWVASFAEDACSYDPAGSEPHVGHEALGRFFDSIVGLTERIGLSEDSVFICGNEAAVKWTGRGVGKNKKRFVFEGIDLFEFDAQGRIKTVRAYWDPTKLMAQLQ